jgi:hypothetical protein
MAMRRICQHKAGCAIDCEHPVTSAPYLILTALLPSCPSQPSPLCRHRKHAAPPPPSGEQIGGGSFLRLPSLLKPYGDVQESTEQGSAIVINQLDQPSFLY